MSDAWRDRERVKEEEFFEQQNKEALKKMRTKGAPKVRLSPISGQPMQQVSVSGVVIDYCPQSGYIGLDAVDLKKIFREVRVHDEDWLLDFFESLPKLK